MNTHYKIELPPLPEDHIASIMLGSEVRRLMRRYGERCAIAAIEPYIETLFKIGEHLGIDYQASRTAPGKPSDVYIAAIESDRKRKGEVVVTKTPEGEIIAVTRQDDEGRILSVIAEADSKRRGEPVVLATYHAIVDESEKHILHDTRTNQLEIYDERGDAEKAAPDHLSIVPVYVTATEGPLYTAPQPAEPVRERLETTSEHIARDIREGRFPDKSERQTVPAEPVKGPSDDIDAARLGGAESCST